MTSAGLGFLDCAMCGHALFDHDLQAELGDPSCLAECPPRPTDEKFPGAFRECECPGYQVPQGLFTYVQVVELLQAAGENRPQNSRDISPAISDPPRRHRATGKPRGRPRKIAMVAP